MRTFASATRATIAATMIGAAALGVAGAAVASHELAAPATHAISHVHPGSVAKLRAITTSHIDGEWFEDGGRPDTVQVNRDWLEDGGHPA